MCCLTSRFATVNAVTADFAPRRAANGVAAVVLAIESGFAALSAVLYVVFALVKDTTGPPPLALAAVAAIAAVGLGLLARGLWQARRWAVSPSITWQVLQGFVGAYAISTGAVVEGSAALALAVVGVAALAVIARTDASAS